MRDAAEIPMIRFRPDGNRGVTRDAAGAGAGRARKRRAGAVRVRIRVRGVPPGSLAGRPLALSREVRKTRLSQ